MKFAYAKWTMLCCIIKHFFENTKIKEGWCGMRYREKLSKKSEQIRIGTAKFLMKPESLHAELSNVSILSDLFLAFPDISCRRGGGGVQVVVKWEWMFTQVSKFTFGCFITNLAFHLNSVDGHDLNKTVSWWQSLSTHLMCDILPPLHV